MQRECPRLPYAGYVGIPGDGDGYVALEYVFPKIIILTQIQANVKCNRAELLETAVVVRVVFGKIQIAYSAAGNIQICVLHHETICVFIPHANRFEGY
jgi:hypothetical protein